MLDGPQTPLADLAASLGKCRKRMTRLLALSCLSPEIVQAIVEGRQPASLSATRLLQTELPLDWKEQRTALGMAA